MRNDGNMLMINISMAALLSVVLEVLKIFNILNISWVWALSPILVLCWFLAQSFVFYIIYFLIKGIKGGIKRGI